MSSETVRLRRPNDGDGYNLHQLVARCQPLDTNSVYCNLLQCSDFADTAIAAESAFQTVLTVEAIHADRLP